MTNDTKAPELLPCPFCGSEATHAKTRRGWKVECTSRMGSCYINARTHYQPHKHLASQAWNTRHDHAQAALDRMLQEAEVRGMKKAARPIIWEDTREVSFDDSVVWSKGYDFHAWELLREEAETADGRFAVWECPAHGWSYYGGQLGFHQGGFVDEVAAKDAVRSHHILALIDQMKGRSDG